MPTGGGSGGGGARAIEAGRAFVRLFTDDSMLARGLAAAEKRLAQFSKFALGRGAALVGIGTAILAPLTLAVDSLNDLGRQSDIAKAFGLTAEQFTGVAGVANSAGEETREFIESLVTLGKLGTDAANGTQEAAKAFAGLGINAKEFIKLRADEQFYQVFEALSRVQDPLQRTRFLMQALGEDGGKYLQPLLSKTPEQLRAMGSAFAKSQADLDAAKQAQEAYTEATAGIGRVWHSVVIAVAPVVTQVAKAVTEVAKPVGEFIGQNQQLVTSWVAVGASMVATGGVLIATGVAAGLLSAGIGGLLGVLGAVKVVALAMLTPAGLLVAALAAAGAGLIYLYATSADGGAMFARLKGGFAELAETIAAAFGGIRDALAAGDLDLAARIGFSALKLEWAKVMLFFQEKWNGFKGFFVDGWHDAIYLAKLALNDLTAEIEKVSQTAAAKSLAEGTGASSTLTGWALEFAKVTAPGVAPLLAASGGNAVAASDAKAIEDERQRRENEITAQARREQEARTAGRKADIDDVQKEIDRLKGEFAALTEEAKQAAFDEMMYQLTRVDAGAARAGSLADQLAGRSRGAFSGPLGQQLAVGDIDKKQLDTLTDIKNGKGGLANAIGGAVASNLAMK
jgi:hypothetical protein